MVLIVALAWGARAETGQSNTPWPAITRQTRPWAYWWWMGSAVDPTNLTRELERYHAAGLGGVHIIPIYGAKGYEDRFIDYLSPKWMEMLAHTVREADRLGMGVDMTAGTGWCFGGPHVTDLEANASVVVKRFEVGTGGKLTETPTRQALQALVAFSPEGKPLELTDELAADGSVRWSPTNGGWRVYAISQRPSGQKVKRAAPGGQGHMLNLIYPAAMRHYLQWFEQAFGEYSGPKPRALYHDSYEYRSDWAPDFFTEFERRRGYRLQTELRALFDQPLASPRAQSPDARHSVRDTSLDHIARVKSDYRETISDVMVEESLPLWADWSRQHGFLTRNEAHGSPGNWLDLYAAADIPETEMFFKDRSKLVSKFASSAAHVVGKNLVAAETGTWLKEHFTETLAEMKYLLDDMFLSGINHVFYHGTCYSPDEAGWPGWHFYASYEMNPRNSIWRDVPALNEYAARCQAVLLAGRPDNDILLYWPIHDLWHNPAGTVRPLTVHARDWFEEQPIGKVADELWNAGYAFDYVSDRQLASAKVVSGKIAVPGGGVYQIVLVPRSERIPVSTFKRLLALAESGATILFEGALPSDVPGLGRLESRRLELQTLLKELKFRSLAKGTEEAALGKGRVLLAGALEPSLALAQVRREFMFDQPGLMCLRRATEDGSFYFVANRSEQLTVNGWVPLATSAQAVNVMDPLSGRTGLAASRTDRDGHAEVFVQLQPGESLLLSCAMRRKPDATPWPCWESAGVPAEVAAPWRLSFLQGGPELPVSTSLSRLTSWTELNDTNAQRFAGTGHYTTEFDAPSAKSEHWQLDLGNLAQSAHIRLNGQDLGTLIISPFRVVCSLKPKGNVLEVEVTNVSANRIRDLDRRGVKWKTFYDINFVGLDYKPFDASNWPLTEAGLLGPVTLTPVVQRRMP
jgi:hypothetical protein